MFGRGVLEAIIKRGEAFNQRKRTEYLQTLKHSNAFHLRNTQSNHRPCLLRLNDTKFETPVINIQMPIHVLQKGGKKNVVRLYESS
jgi:hypothetical protein